MADGHFPTLVSKDRLPNALTNPIFTQPTNGTTAGLNPGTGATDLGKAVDDAAGATDTGLTALFVRDDVLATLTPADGDYVRGRTNDRGAIWVALDGSSFPSKVDDSAFAIGTDSVSPAGYLADETAPDSVDEGDVGLARMTLDRKQLMVIVDPSTDANRWAISAAGAGSINLTQVNGTAHSETNPVFVQVVNTAVSGSEIHDYDTTASVAADGTDNHDYTVANTTFLLKSVIFSSSGAGKVEIQTGPLASLATDAVAFVSTFGGTQQLFFDPPIEVPVTSTGTVRLIRTNREGATQDVYSTIIGNDVT